MGLFKRDNLYTYKPSKQKYAWADDFVDGIARVCKKTILGYKWGYIDLNGNVAIPIKYDSIGEFIGGYAIVKSKKRYGIIDRQNQQVFPFVFTCLEDAKYALKDLVTGDDARE